MMNKPAAAAAMALAAGLAALSGCQSREAAAPAAAAPPIISAPPISAAAVDARRLAAREPDQWLTLGGDWTGAYYSPLKDIDAGNVGRLGFAWDYRLGTNRGQESTPLVIDGVMYATSNFGRVYALDAATGRELWKYDPRMDGQWARYACCDAVNRGLAAFDGRLYVGALDGWLHALDARTGQLVWKVDTVIGRREHAPYTFSGAPLLAGDLVIVGSAGGDFAAARGYVSAYDLKNGELRWRFFTVPRNPADGPQDQPHLEAAVKTWNPAHRWDAGSGGTVWDGMAYDPTLRLVYFGTGNAAPYNSYVGGRHTGDQLYAASIMAVHADSGALAWYYQTVPGDRWDFDSTQKLVLADIERRWTAPPGADASRQERLLLRARPQLRRALVGAQFCIRQLDARSRPENRPAHRRPGAPIMAADRSWCSPPRPARTAGSQWPSMPIAG